MTPATVFEQALRERKGEPRAVTEARTPRATKDIEAVGAFESPHLRADIEAVLAHLGARDALSASRRRR